MMIEKLSQPLSELEIKNGWGKECQQAMLKLFGELEESIKNDKVIQEMHIARGLDHWGVVGGDLMEKIAKISVDLNEYRKKTTGSSLKPKKSLLKKGVIIFVVGFLVNVIFVMFGIGGIVRELARLAVIVGVVLIIIGVVKKLITKKPS